MRTFDIECIITKRYRVSVDETIHNDEWFAEFRKHFYNLHDQEDIAEFLARYESLNFNRDSNEIEGFGFVTINGKLPYLAWKNNKTAALGLNIEIIRNDNDPEITSTEVIEKVEEKAQA